MYELFCSKKPLISKVISMFSKKFSLSIPDPCQENWDQMTNIKGGKFCQSCQKNVIDFSNKTEKEIYQTLKNAKGRVCGKFRVSQVNMSLTADTKPQWLHYLLKLKVYFVTLFTLLTSSPSKILYAKQKSTITTDRKKMLTQAELTFTSGGENLTDESKKILSGQVVDEKKQPIKNATIYINIYYSILNKSEFYYILADGEGKFSTIVQLIDKDYTISLEFFKDEKDTRNYDYSWKKLAINPKTSSENLFIELPAKQEFFLTGDVDVIIPKRKKL